MRPALPFQPVQIEVRDGDVIFTTYRVRYAGKKVIEDHTETVSLKELIREILRGE